jgi:hypothetical protein
MHWISYSGLSHYTIAYISLLFADFSILPVGPISVHNASITQVI